MYPLSLLPHFARLTHTRVRITSIARDVRMEVEVDTHTERKEGADGALVQVRESDEDGSPDSPMQIDHGQTHISR